MADADSAAVLRQLACCSARGRSGGRPTGSCWNGSARGEGATEADAAEAAFAVLVARHGPMVLGVCRRALRDPDDVADAFQATFLVLVRKAGSVRVDDSLGRWLYGVSRRVAVAGTGRRAPAAPARDGKPSGRTRSRPGRRSTPAAPSSPGRSTRRSARLPEPYRSAVVLCDLGGLTHEAAARRAGLPGRDRREPALPGPEAAPRAAHPPRPRASRPSRPGWVWLSAAVPEALSVSTVQAAFAAGYAAASGGFLSHRRSHHGHGLDQAEDAGDGPRCARRGVRRRGRPRPSG